MIKFRQKIFFMNALMIGGTALGLKQGHDQGKEQEKANEEQAELLREQNRRLQKIAESQKEGKPVDGQALQAAMQRGFSSPTGFLGQGKLFLKDMKNLAWKHKDHLAGTAMMGAGMGLAAYGANKYIQHDMKKQGLEEAMIGNTQQKAYSAGQFALNTLKKNWKTTAVLGAGMGAAPTIIGYEADKKQIKNQIAATQQEQQRAYSFSVGKTLSKLGKSIQTGLKNFKDHPGQSILGSASSMAMGGGSKGVTNVGHAMVPNGQATWTQKIGKFMLNKDGTGPSKKGLAMSIPVGMGIMAATWEAPEKAIEKATRTVDKGAYAYQDSKNQQL